MYNIPVQWMEENGGEEWKIVKIELKDWTALMAELKKKKTQRRRETRESKLLRRERVYIIMTLLQ